ncbi:hypothetical protein BY458DRAFT_534429 [Sporodiniella umbellata]|nr:hypothetical protein BY458DRAFT_534429 [Sporodiniella umbellata]
MLSDFERAKECFKEALSVDLKCYDALEALVTYSMMNREEEQEFVMTLPFDDHCGLDANYYRYLYSLRLTKSDPKEKIVEPKTNDLSLSLDVQFSEAERHFTEGSYETCLEICKNIQSQDPYYKDSIYVLLSCLYELNQKMQLYVYAQEIVNDSKKDAIKWHAVGLYYLFIKRNTDAKRYFTQVTL